MWNATQDESQAGIQIARGNINNLRYAGDTTLMAENEEEWKNILIRVKEERGKSWLKTQHSKIKIMVSSAITSWQIGGEKVETRADFLFLGSKITADCDCNHKIKRCLLLGRKAITKLDSVLKSRDITLPTKVDIAKAMVFPAAMYGCECWTINKADHQRIDSFKLWCWIRFQRVPWTARISNQQS